MCVALTAKFNKTWEVLSKGNSVRPRATKMIFYWQGELEIHLGCELLSNDWAGQNHWQDLVNTYPESESFFRIWADKNHWWERVNIHSESESLSRVMV